VVGPAGPDGDLSDAIHGVGNAVRILRSEPFVDVVVTVENQVDVGGVEESPDRLRVVVGTSAGAEERDMPVGKRALVGVGR
jgi:hypothetical protein